MHQAAAGEAGAERQDLALCLSGGGFRATLFHLGAARRLHELGVLDRLDTISSVSGGSIFSGMLADLAIRSGWQDGLRVEDFEAQVATPVRRLARRDLRTAPFLVHAAYNWLLPGPRARHLVALCNRHVSDRRLGELPDRPRFVFCATDLTFGVNWESSKARTGSFQAGYLRDGGEWSIGRAVGASACFPPVFGPLRVGAPAGAFRGGAYPRDAEGVRLREILSLSDGGVYDNMAFQPAVDSHRTVLISDCGAPFAFRSGGHVLRRLLRYTSVVQNQAHDLRVRMFFTGITKQWHRGALWGIDTRLGEGAPGYSDALVAERISRIRTDLDPFTDAEQRILENHGYCVAEHRVRTKAPHLLPAVPPAAAPPHPDWMDEAVARAALRDSHRRISIRRLRGRP